MFRPKHGVATCLLLALMTGCQPDKTLSIDWIQPATRVVEGQEKFAVVFRIDGYHGNPYDSRQIDVNLSLTGPSGQTVVVPAYYTQPYDVLLDRQREVIRRRGKGHWRVDWNPLEPGEYRWTLEAITAAARVDQRGTVGVRKRTKSGRVGVDASGHGFALSDGRSFYPMGHGMRSPIEHRWASFNDVQPQRVAEIEARQTFNYDDWFNNLSRRGGNYCVVWMAPWWLGLQWSETAPGYGGLGSYNQLHAAKLDRIMELAERHGIKVLLYTMNHGQLSSVVDAEWSRNPYNAAVAGGLAEHPIDFFTDPRCREHYKHYLRYLVARYSHHESLFALGLCTETNWVEPFDGRRCTDPQIDEFGTAKPHFAIGQRPKPVKDWFAEMAAYVKSIDPHEVLISVQFARLGGGERLWRDPNIDFCLSNCYEGDARQREIQKQLKRPSTGVAESLFGWSAYHRSVSEKPILVGEWGGTFLGNSKERLAAEIHIGSWALSMTGAAGVTGFWWWNEVARSDLDVVYAGLGKYWEGVDRSDHAADSVQLAIGGWPGHVDADESDAWVPSGTHGAIGRVTNRRLYGYVYHLLASAGEFEVKPSGDFRIIASDGLRLLLPESLRGDRFRLEWYETQEGTMLGYRTVSPLQTGAGRVIELPPVAVDLAFKLFNQDDDEDAPRIDAH